MKDNSGILAIILTALIVMFVMSRFVESQRHTEVMAKLNTIEDKVTAK